MIIDGIDIEATYGVCMADGAYKELWKLPVRKKGGYGFDWPEENGLEIDEDEIVVYERLIYSVPMMIVAANETQYWTRMNSFLEWMLEKNIVVVDIPERNRRFYLQQLGFSGYDDYVDNGFSLFNMELANDNPSKFLPII